MKRIVSLVVLTLAVSVASFANAISSAAGTNLLGPNAGLVDFESSSFPIGSFSSLASFNIPTTNGTIVASISFGGSGGSGSAGTATNQFGAFYNNTGKYLTNINYNGIAQPGTAALGQFARTLTITFSTPVSEFLIDQYANDARLSPGNGSGNLGLNYFTVNGGGTQYALQNQTNNTLAQSGYTTTGDTNGVTQINSVTFTINGFDQNPNYGLDAVLFDNLRVFATSGTQTSSSSSSNPGAVPEPSTYALVGAGLAALAYLRRKK